MILIKPKAALTAVVFGAALFGAVPPAGAAPSACTSSAPGGHTATVYCSGAYPGLTFRAKATFYYASVHDTNVRYGNCVAHGSKSSVTSSTGVQQGGANPAPC